MQLDINKRIFPHHLQQPRQTHPNLCSYYLYLSASKETCRLMTIMVSIFTTQFFFKYQSQEDLLDLTFAGSQIYKTTLFQTFNF